jgi:hypothetical protein
MPAVGNSVASIRETRWLETPIPRATAPTVTRHPERSALRSEPRTGELVTFGATISVAMFDEDAGQGISDDGFPVAMWPSFLDLHVARGDFARAAGPKWSGYRIALTSQTLVRISCPRGATVERRQEANGWRVYISAPPGLWAREDGTEDPQERRAVEREAHRVALLMGATIPGAGRKRGYSPRQQALDSALVARMDRARATLGRDATDREIAGRELRNLQRARRRLASLV